MKNKKVIWILLVIIAIVIATCIFLYLKNNNELHNTNIEKSEQLVGTWKVQNKDTISGRDVKDTNEKYDFYSAELHFNSKGDMKLYSNSTGVCDYTPIMDYRYNYSFEDSNIKITPSKLFPQERSEDYIPVNLQLESDGRLLSEFKDGTKLYFTKISDETNIDFEAENKKNNDEIEKINSVKNETRKFAEKYFKENSIEAEEVEKSHQKVSNYQCSYLNKDGKYIYIIDEKYCNVHNNEYLEYFESDGDWSIGHRCKYQQVENYVITELEEINL